MAINKASQIKTIIFDLGRVIVDFEHQAICTKLAEHSPFSPDRIYEIIFKSDLEPSFDKGLVSAEKFYSKVKKEAELKLGIDCFKEIWTNIFKIIPGIDSILTALKKKHKMLCLSNTNQWHFEFCLEKFPVLNLFDDFILSYEIGHSKPDKAIFEKALQKAGALPSECIYIDDVVEFVEKAKETGINGIHFTSVKDLNNELSALNII